MTEDELSSVVRYYDSEDIKISHAYSDGGMEPLWPRFERAALNQITGGDATFSRYAIWANTLRDNLLEAIESLDREDKNEVKKLLVRVINNLSAFSEIQRAVDPFMEDGVVGNNVYLLDKDGNPHRTADGSPLHLSSFDQDPSYNEDMDNRSLSEIVEDMERIGIPVPDHLRKELEKEKKKKE